MKKLAKEYRLQVTMDPEQIVRLMIESTDFREEDSPNFGGQIYTSAVTNKVIYRKLSENIFQVSENAGLGGMFEIIGDLKIHRISIGLSEISLRFTIGIFSIFLPYYLSGVFVLMGLCFLLHVPLVSFISSILLIMSLFMILIKMDRVSFFMKKICKALKVENKWKIYKNNAVA